VASQCAYTAAFFDEHRATDRNDCARVRAVNQPMPDEAPVVRAMLVSAPRDEGVVLVARVLFRRRRR
jgi:hypothetical protein